MRKIIKKGDIVLLVIFMAAAVLIACIPALRSAFPRNAAQSAETLSPEQEDSARGLQVVVTIAGSVYGTWPLSGDRVIEVSSSRGTNEVTIRDSSVSVTKSDCANQICVETGAIREEGQMILCLPHRLAVEIRPAAKEDEEYDAIAR